MGATTIPTLYAESLVEPCLTFHGADGSPVCEECGWLDHEHALGARDRRPPLIRRPARRGARHYAAAS